MDLSWLKCRHRFRTLIDVGANSGEFGQHLATVLGIEKVISFEPLPSHANELRARGFTVHSVALGDSDGKIAFHENHYSGASSALRLTERCITEFPQVAQWQDIRVEQRRLDGIPMRLEREIIIKVDAQGAEAAILRGGQQTFLAASAVLIEMILVSLYEGQELFGELHARLVDLGLSFVGFRGQQLAKNGEPLFAHCIYERMS